MSPDDLLDAVGLSPEALSGGDWPLEAVRAAVLRLREQLIGAAPLERVLVRDGAVRRLRKVTDSPARIVDAALAEAAADPGAEHFDSETYGDGILDVVLEGADLRWLVVKDGRVSFEEEHNGRRPWARANLPWPTIPSAADVKAALEAGGRPPMLDLMTLHQERSVLPEPAAGWAALLAGWCLGTYHLDAFHYFPILLFDGPPERGKTRAAKATLWPSHRGMYTPSPSPATIFRDRARHRVSILLDVEDLPLLLKRGGDLADLMLNSFEQDGVIRRCTRPDAKPELQVETFAAYGPTIIVTNRSVADSSPLASRCVRIAMPEAGGRVVPDAMRPEEARLVRARAVAWTASMAARGEKLPKVDSPFTGRLRDLSMPILRVLQLVAPEHVPLVHSILGAADRERRAEAATSWEARVAIALWQLRGQVTAGRIYVQTIAERFKADLIETEWLTPQQVGIARRQLGLQGGKGGSPPRAYIAWPGDEMAKTLHDRYAPPPARLDPEASEGTRAQPGDALLPTSEAPWKRRKQVGWGGEAGKHYNPADPSDASDAEQELDGRRGEDDDDQGDHFQPSDSGVGENDVWRDGQTGLRPTSNADGDAHRPGVEI